LSGHLGVKHYFGAGRESGTKLRQEPSSHIIKYHPTSDILGDPKKGVTIRSKLKNYEAMISQIELRNVDEALEDENWIQAMKEELDQFEKNDF